MNARQGRRRPHAQRAGRYQPSSRAHGVSGGGRISGGGGGGGRRKRNGPAALIGAVIFLLIIISIAVQAGKGRSTGNTSPAPAIVPTQTTASINSETDTATATETAVATSQAAAPSTQTAPSTPVQTTPAAAPTSAAAPTGCYPLSNEGTCYEPGEYCRNSDHGASGVAGDGEAITCEDNDGWRWEPS
jgi:hypothetical protein